MPSKLLFYDDLGTVLLLGRRFAGVSSNLLFGTGRVEADRAVLGVAQMFNYPGVHGLRSTVSGLRDWLGVSAVAPLSNSASTQSVEIGFKVVRVEPLRVPSNPAITFAVEGSAQTSSVGATLTTALYIEDRTDTPRRISDHLERHAAVRDLIALSRWRPESIEAAAVCHDNEQASLPDGSKLDRWLDVANGRPFAAVDESLARHLIQFSDIGLTGIARWIALRQEFARAIDPAVSGIYMQEVTPEARLVQTAVGIEALGYLILIKDDSVPAAKARASSFEARLERVAKDVPFTLLGYLNAAWFKAVADAYNATKHANRTLPSGLHLMNAWRESTLLFRVWAALRLGVPASALESRIRQDWQFYAFSQRVD
ncbi:hypothetical protein ACFOYW_00390 [Gryllotalpicola reticulitermitis]|uniref:ApeA N-terminal domain-containing protein n=1 Tax=Gryllotalpicola reticulitermitis TaxID=1184153 RepID=A0ABV8Q344_9MICO